MQNSNDDAGARKPVLAVSQKVGDQLITVDNFFDDFYKLRAKCYSLDYSDGVNDADGVTYPYVNTDVPGRDQIVQSVGEPADLFLRLSPKGVYAPHPVHCDTLQSNATMLIYINDPPHRTRSGTAIVRHKETGLMDTPQAPEEFEVWQADYRNPEAWEIVHFFEMKANRAVFFSSRLMHMAWPIDGFGRTARNGRLIIGGFFK